MKTPKNITGADVVSISAINAAIAKAFSADQLDPVVAYLKEMWIAVPPNPTKYVLDQEIRQLGVQLPEDPVLRQKAYAAAKTIV